MPVVGKLGKYHLIQTIALILHYSSELGKLSNAYRNCLKYLYNFCSAYINAISM